MAALGFWLTVTVPAFVDGAQDARRNVFFASIRRHGQ